jgi:hypothetical protein
MAKAQEFKLPKMPPSPPLLRIEPFKGVNYSVTPTQISQSQSPDMMNMQIDERGALNKRTGYTRVFPTSLGAGAINGMYTYRKKDGTEFFLIAHGTKLYTQSGSDQPVQIYSGLADKRVSFFTFNGKCYIMDGTNYLVFDGTTVSNVVPYVPTLTISNLPTGGGTLLEDFNLLGTGFKETYTGDGTAKVFQLSLKGLDATAVVAKVDNVAKSEGTDFTVDRTLGKVTFTVAPPVGTNNVEIIAHKTYAGFADRIKKCTFNILYGGSNDTRVFWGGNPDEPNQIWRSGLTDLNEPNYAPENGNYTFPDKVTGFSKQYDSLIVHRLNGAHSVTFDLSSGEASFPSKPINDQVGTIAPNSIQIIENNPVSLSKDGVYMLVQSNVRDERNVQHVSANVEPNLLSEQGLENAVSVDFDRKYWLALNGKVYVFDYALNEWYPFDNIHANCFLERNRELYFGSSSEGLVYRFKKKSELYPYNDDGQIIDAYWMSKVMSFDSDEQLKLVEKVYFSLNPATRTSADLYYVSDKKTRKFIKTTRKDLFHYGFMDYSEYSYGSREYPQEASNKIKAKKIVYFQLEIRNERIDEPLGLLSLGIKFTYQRLVK